MNHLKNLSVILIGLIVLSGCAGRGARAKQVKKQLNSAEIIKPLDKPLVLNVENTVSNHLTSLPRNSYLVDQDKSFEIAISEHGYTRFSIEDERITDVFVHPQEDIQVKIHDQGYLIIVPKQLKENEEESAEVENNIRDEKIYVTVTGEHGTTQDFSLRFTGKFPEPVKFVKSKLGIINLSKGD